MISPNMDTTEGIVLTGATTEEIFADDGVTDTDCKVFTFVLYIGVFGTIFLLGLVGNTVSFVVLQWEKQNKVATFLLQMMAIYDNLFLLVTGFVQIYSSVTVFMEVNPPASPYIAVFIWPLVHLTQMTTVWITVLIAFNRYIAICRPFQAPMLCTMSRTRLQLIVMTLFAVIYNIPRFLELKLAYPSENSTDTSVEIDPLLVSNRAYTIIYQNILYFLFIFLGPLCILIYLNTCLCRELWRARQRLVSRNLPVNGEEEEQNLTLVMVVIILIFLVCQAPAFLNQLIPLFYSEDPYRCGHWYYYYYHISNIVVSANSSLNFVVYCVFRKQFRARLWAFCGCKQRSAMDCSSSYSGYTAYATVNGKADGAAHL